MYCKLLFRDEMVIKPKPLIIIFTLCTFAYLAIQCGVLINITPSMKRGVYIKSSNEIERGSIISLCIDEPYKQQGLTSQYIQKGPQCHGAYPLIKEVVAVPGDDVKLQDHYFAVNGKAFFYDTQHQDSKGRSITIFPRGNYPNTKGYWVIGTNAKNSWDSRYWGPVDKKQIINNLKPLLTW